MVKRGVRIVFSLVFLILLIGFVYSANSCSITSSCAAANTVMRLSSTTNAHGELYSGSAYSQYLCCDFTGTHTCDTSGSNVVLRLSSATNAHAEISSLSNYPDADRVCFGQVTCYTTSGSCNSGDVQMVSLSATTNAHLAQFSDYGTKICCNPNLDICGDGSVTPPEQCDGGNLNGQSCSSRGFDRGTLSCYAAGSPNECTFNTAACCDDTCSPGATQCSGASSFQTCVSNYDGDPCYEWGAVTSCPGGQTCSGVSCTCSPTTCAAQGKNCGTISDGCGGTLNCGSTACGDGNACTSDSCTNNVCTHSPITCDDGEECTDNSCSTSSGCVFTPRTGLGCSSDGNECTNDVCSSWGTCINPDKPDGTACTDEGDACTIDVCSGGNCEHNERNSCIDGDGLCCGSCDYTNDNDCDRCLFNFQCDDNNDCTDDTCSSRTCVYSWIAGCCTSGSECGDGDVCTNDVCNGNSCFNPSINNCCYSSSDCSAGACQTASCSSNQCNYNPIIVCAPNDGCCPTGCNLLNDNDCGIACGDGTCSTPTENCNNCAADCENCCGDNICNYGETCSTCLGDCPCTGGKTCQGGVCIVPSIFCGNGVINAGEDCDDWNTISCDGCSATCQNEGCGDGECACGETCNSCSTDCNSCCGDGICNYGEDCSSCNGDCPCTGGDTCQSGVCVPPTVTCPDNYCDPATENCNNCAVDCGACTGTCPDNYCDPATEDCSICPADCGACPPGNCDLTSATWNQTTAFEGDPVRLNIAGTNCNGKSISFVVMEKDTLFNNRVRIDPVSITFSPGAYGNWIAEWQDDSEGFEENPPEYYFVASVNGESENIASSKNVGEMLEVNQRSVICFGINYCADYKIQAECEADGCTVGPNSIPEDIICGSWFDELTGCDANTDCGCAWNFDLGTCEGKWESSETCNPDACVADFSVNDCWLEGDACQDDCTCEPGYTPNGDGYCDPTNVCGPGDECWLQGDHCTDACVCEIGYLTNNDGTCGDDNPDVCDPATNDCWLMGDKCQYDCTCESGYTQNGLGYCYPIHICGPGDLCWLTGDRCKMDCTCEPGYTANGLGICTSDGEPGTDKLIGICSYNENSADTCDDGWLVRSLSANWIWDISNNYPAVPAGEEESNYIPEPPIFRYDPERLSQKCVYIEDTFACPAQVQLSFFGFYQFIIVIAIVVLIYLIYVLRKKNHAKNSKRITKKKKSR